MYEFLNIYKQEEYFDFAINYDGLPREDPFLLLR